MCREAFLHCPERVRLVVFSDGVGFDNVVNPSDILPVDISWIEMPAAEFAKFAETENPQGVLAVLEHPGEAKLDVVDDPFVLVLDRVQDPGNAGTILRTAWAAGLRTVVATSGTVDLFSPKCLRAGMGAQFSLKTHALADLCEVRDRLNALGFQRMWESVPSGGVSCYSDEFDLRKSALVVGNEANGSALLPDSNRVTIPMPGHAESLNAAQAATILIFESVRRRLA